MEVIVGIGITIFVLVSALIMPWMHRSDIKNLEKKVKYLTATLEKLKADIKTNSHTVHAKKQPKQQHSSAKSASTQSTEESQTTTQYHPTSIQRTFEQKAAWNDHPSDAIDSQKSASNTQAKENSKIGFEQQFGARLPVWIGGVALALAGLFLVKYSIENNLLSPFVRIILGSLLGAGLLSSAQWIRNKPDFSNGTRIAQSLAGAGIAVLYIVSFAAAQLYHMIPIIAGFIAMAVVTATALTLSLRHGPPIAVLGMLGGFLTPALLNTGSGNVVALFIYLYATASGLLLVVRKTQWWWLSIPTIIAALLWVLVWLFFSYHPGDSLYLWLFLLGICATIIISSRQQYENDGGGTISGIFKLTSIVNYLGLAGSVILMGVIAQTAGFGSLEWGLFALLTIGGVGLAYFNEKLYGFLPSLSMVITAVMLLMWQTNEHSRLALTLITFASIYIGSGSYLMFQRTQWPLLWAALCASSSLFYYLLAYFKLHNSALLIGIPVFWGATAILFAAGACFILFKIHGRFSNYRYRDHLYTVFAITATAFTSLALTVELSRDFLPVAITVEMLAIAWINNRVSIQGLSLAIKILACVFGLLLLPQILLMVQLAAFSLIEIQLYIQKLLPLVKWPIFQLGVPAIMFLGCAYLLCKKQDNRLVNIFEYIAISLFAVMGYYLTRNLLNPNQNILFITAGFFERGLITNIFFIYGLACFWVGRRFIRAAFSWSGIILCGVAAFRIIYFDIIIHNPIWDTQLINGIAIFNSLLLPYGLPIIWVYYAKKELKQFNQVQWAAYTGYLSLILIFILISSNIRFIFHGEYLNTGITSNAEIYIYSAAWLLLGIALLIVGTLKQNKVLRFASLGIILLTVGKVFLYDASELEGLYRVFSFLGLGISLIGLSYFYTRFVFVTESQPNKNS